MTELKRLLDDPGTLTYEERRTLAADTKFLAPPQAKSQLWSSIAASLGTAAFGPSLSSSSVAPSSVGAGLQAATGGTAAGHVLSLGAAVKLTLLGIGFGTSVVTASHFWFANELSQPPRVFNTAHAPGAEGTVRPNAVAIQSASTAKPVEPPPSRAADNQVGTATPNPKLPIQSIESLALARSGDPRTSRTPGSSSYTPTPPESKPDSSSANAREESQLVSSTRALLRAGNAAAALQLLERSAGQFAQGVLIQEREALCVEALAALGRTSEASAHAEAFIRTYPKSPYVSRVKSRISKVNGNTH